jgi:hypothetical protein
VQLFITHTVLSTKQSADDTQYAAHEVELTSRVKGWICSREIGTINVSDVKN